MEAALASDSPAPDSPAPAPCPQAPPSLPRGCHSRRRSGGMWAKPDLPSAPCVLAAGPSGDAAWAWAAWRSGGKAACPATCDRAPARGGEACWLPQGHGPGAPASEQVGGGKGARVREEPARGAQARGAGVPGRSSQHRTEPGAVPLARGCRPPRAGRPDAEGGVSSQGGRKGQPRTAQPPGSRASSHWGATSGGPWLRRPPRPGRRHIPQVGAPPGVGPGAERVWVPELLPHTWLEVPAGATELPHPNGPPRSPGLGEGPPTATLGSPCSHGQRRRATPGTWTLR